MSISKRLKLTGAAVGVLAIVLSFQNCANQTGSPSDGVSTTTSSSTTSSTTRSGGMGSGSTTTTSGSGTSTIPGGGTTTGGSSTGAGSISSAPIIAIYCTSVLHETNSATCSTVITGDIIKGSWFVDGSEVLECRDQKSCTWNNIAAGIYKVKVVALDTAGRAYTSNEATVQVVAATLSIATPAAVYCNQALNAGQSATCAAIVSKEVVTGSWYVNGTKYLECENKRSCTWTNVPAGSYAVHVVVNLSSGASYQSSPFMVTAK